MCSRLMFDDEPKDLGKEVLRGNTLPPQKFSSKEMQVRAKIRCHDPIEKVLCKLMPNACYHCGEFSIKAQVSASDFTLCPQCKTCTSLGIPQVRNNSKNKN